MLLYGCCLAVPLKYWLVLPYKHEMNLYVFEIQHHVAEAADRMYTRFVPKITCAVAPCTEQHHRWQAHTVSGEYSEAQWPLDPVETSISCSPYQHSPQSLSTAAASSQHVAEAATQLCREVGACSVAAAAREAVLGASGPETISSIADNRSCRQWRSAGGELVHLINSKSDQKPLETRKVPLSAVRSQITTGSSSSSRSPHLSCVDATQGHTNPN